ncbi:hypothetical protein [Micromonospora coriariae]|uniref:hypothetical protein n=1 Tax=Micromonospora coriariae TaxID=285665 RepID=UPI0012FDCEFE|nr:hypothetical protein [Micromonospora coriariae]
MSILLHVCPQAVGADFVNGNHIADERPMLLVHGMAGYTKTGIIGRPSAGTADKGRALLASLAESFDDHLSSLLDERQPPRSQWKEVWNLIQPLLPADPPRGVRWGDHRCCRSN